MRIGVDLRVLTKGFHSGVPEYTLNIIENILKLDRISEFHFFYNGIKKEPLNFDWLRLENSFLHDFYFPNKIFDLINLFFRQPKIDKLLGGLDVYFMPHFNLANTNCPRVLTFHDLSFVRYPEFFPLRKRYWHFSQKPKKQAKEARHLIAVSESTKIDLIEYFEVPADKISVVYHGIREIYLKNYSGDEIDDARKKLSDIYHLPERYILYMGTIEPRKNIITLIKAFNILKEKSVFKGLKLVLAGPLGWLHQETLKEAKKSKYNNDIIFLGPVSLFLRPFIYRFARILVLPSFFEGFGFPPLEAMACGTATIVSNRSSLPEVTGGASLLFDPYRIEELIFCLEKILLDDDLRHHFISRGKENIKRFSWKKAASETLDILIDAAKK